MEEFKKKNVFKNYDDFERMLTLYMFYNEKYGMSISEYYKIMHLALLYRIAEIL